MTNRVTSLLLVSSTIMIAGCKDGGPEDFPSASIPVIKNSRGILLGGDMWGTFVAINWPADLEKERGDALKPDELASFANFEAPRVWETWKQDFEAQDWEKGGLTDWTKYEIKTERIPCKYFQETPDGDIVKVDDKEWKKLYEEYHTVLTAVNTFKPGPEGPMDAGPVIDVSGEYVRSEIRYNQVVYDCLKDEKSNVENEKCTRHIAGKASVVLPGARSAEEKIGSITLKAAWRKVAGGIENFKRRYYVRTLLVADYMNDPTNAKRLVTLCRPQESALVGLHIVYKLANGEGNRWVWATFEHVDNAPLCSSQRGPEHGFSFMPIPIPKVGYSYEPDPVRHPDLVYPRSGRVPVMLCRRDQIQNVAKSSNDDFKDNFKEYSQEYSQEYFQGNDPWSNYQMTGLQWPEGRETPSNTPVANVVLEPYAQEDSCMKCHAGRSADTDFVWSLVPSKMEVKDPPSPGGEAPT